MQKKSDAYIEALYDNYVVRSTIDGLITFVTGEKFPITDADIIPGSLTINNKCVNSNSFELGSVYQGELSVQLRKGIDRYKVRGAKIEFTEHRYISDAETEDVYLGAFYVSEPSRSKLILSIKALDRMDNFDTDIQDNIVGTPYDLLTVASEMCDVELEQSEEYFKTLPNGSETFSVYVDTVETYRDMIAYIGMVTGTFAVITNDKLRMRAYSLDTDITIADGKRKETAIEDYETYYKGVKARFIADQNYATYEYVEETPADGLILDLGDIPIVRGVSERKYNILENLFGVLKQIDYIPASFNLLTSDGALELGDKIKLDASAQTYITSLTYVYHGSMKIKGVGDNPRLKTTDKTSKQMADLEASISAKNITVHSYTNASNITLGNREKEIISINYSAMERTRPIFIATIPFTIDLDGYVVFRYYLDNALIAEDTVREYVERGKHFVTLSNNFVIKEDERRTLSVMAYTEFFESDNRQHEAKIISFENYAKTGKYTEQTVDTTVPSATILRNEIKAVLYAQGLSGASIWDGTINISDSIDRIYINQQDMVVRNPTVEGTAVHVAIARPLFVESVSRIAIGSTIKIKGLSATAICAASESEV